MVIPAPSSSTPGTSRSFVAHRRGERQQLTSTHDCALALAIPLTEREWLRDLAPASGREFAKFYSSTRAPRGASPAQVWSKLYEPFEARPIGRILSEAREAGVEVVVDCTLADF